MDTRKVPHFSINRYLLMSVGLWPTDAKTLRHIQQFITAAILLSSMYPQIGALVKYRSNYFKCCKIVLCIMISLVYCIKYINFAYTTEHRMRKTLEWIQSDWETYIKQNEYEILRERGKSGRTVIILHLVAIYPALIASSIFPYARLAYNNLVQPNQTNLLKNPITLEYYIPNEEKYLQWITLHSTTFNIMGTHAVVVAEMTCLMMVEHACALFELVSHYTCNAIEETIAHPNKFVVRRCIKTIVLAHYRALSFMSFLNNSYMLHYSVIIIIGVMSFSLNIYIFAGSLLNTHDFDTLILSVVLIICHLVYLFFCAFAGQKIMDVSSYVPIVTYSTRWYLTPLPMRKFLILFLERCLRISCFISGGLLMPSRELLSSMLSTSLSYFMVLWSLS